MSQNPILPTATRLAKRSLADREAECSAEIQRILDAGLAVMARCGTTSSPRVADIVAEAQVSNEAFYRYFGSKADLVVAVSEAGAERLFSYIAHQMSKRPEPKAQIETWVRCVLAQAGDPAVAEPTRAVFWNAAAVADRSKRERLDANAHLANLLIPPLTEIGSEDPARDATAVTATVFTLLQQYLHDRVQPSDSDVQHAVRFCMRALGIAK